MNELMQISRAKFQCEQFSNCKYIEYHLEHSELLDEDGYPTEEALEIIKRWGYWDAKGWFDFIGSLWYMADWGWHEGEQEGKYIYEISTAGWSGNESLIRSMQEAYFIWSFNWVQSRRGGHYIFELHNYVSTQRKDA
jgi:hypothetical protein